MPRLRQVPRSEAKADIVITMYDKLFGPDRDPVAEPGTAAGTPGDWWTVFALVPDILKHAVRGFSLYSSPVRTIDPVLRELGQTRAGYLKSSQFVYSQHCKSLRKLGVSEERISAVASWGVSDQFTDVERVILYYTDCLVLGGGRVDDATFAAMKKHFTDEQILEYTYITSLYDMHAVISRALHLEFDDREDPIVEVAAPEGYSAGIDIAAAIRGDED